MNPPYSAAIFEIHCPEYGIRKPRGSAPRGTAVVAHVRVRAGPLHRREALEDVAGLHARQRAVLRRDIVEGLRHRPAVPRALLRHLGDRRQLLVDHAPADEHLPPGGRDQTYHRRIGV